MFVIYVVRCLERMFEICPLLNSSIEAVLATGNENSRALAAQNRDCFKQQLLETLRDFVILLQLVKNGKPVPDPRALDVSCTPVNDGYCSTVPMYYWDSCC